MSETGRTVTLPSDQREIALPDLSTEQVLQLIRLAKNVLGRVPDLIELFDEARFDYMKGEARGYVSQPYFEGLSEEEQEALRERLDADFQQWGFYEDLSDEDREALLELDISAESLSEEPIQFSFPTEVPQMAIFAKVFPELWDSCSNEIIMAVAVTMMPAGRLEKAVRTNTVEAQLLDYRAELAQKLKPADFIHLAASVVSYVLGELKELGGPLGETLTAIQGQIGGLVGASPTSETDETVQTKTSETSEPDSSSSSADPLMG